MDVAAGIAEVVVAELIAALLIDEAMSLERASSSFDSCC
jgi:hypothetical protein